MCDTCTELLCVYMHVYFPVQSTRHPGTVPCCLYVGCHMYSLGMRAGTA